ncbi:MAG: hypothetical protein AAFU69_07925 [Pseudomonadota bacterium]
MAKEKAWWQKLVEFLLGMGRKRHLSFARLLIYLGIGCFAAPALYVQLAMILSDNINTFLTECPPPSGIGPTEVAGFVCIVSGVVLFWYFEKREGIVIGPQDGFTLGLPNGDATLQFVLEDMLITRQKPIRLEGFSKARLSAKVKEGEFWFPTLFDAVVGVVQATEVEGEEQPTILLDEQQSQIRVKAEYA